MISSLIWILACPLGMFAMGGIAWGLGRLPGKRAERLARITGRASCMSTGGKTQHDKVDEGTSHASPASEPAAHWG